MIVPAPQQLALRPDRQPWTLRPGTHVVVEGDTAEADLAAIVDRFTADLHRATGTELTRATSAAAGALTIQLVEPAAVVGDEAAGSPEAYTLDVDADGAVVRASTAVGVFRALTSLRQLLAAPAQPAGDPSAQPVDDLVVPAVTIADAPRYAYRGVMLDVSRHFFEADTVRTLIGALAEYKISHLHLHLTDDQGWRFPVASRPALTAVGGPFDYDGGVGGSYTAADYAAIVNHARRHFIEIVPEIDMPGHTRMAMRAYPELSPDGTAPPTHLDADDEWVSIRAGSAATTEFLVDVFDAVVAQSPGALVHFGADEAFSSSADDFRRFVDEAAALIIERGRRPVVWHEAAAADLPPETVVQYWGTDGHEEPKALARRAAAAGHQLIVSPSSHVYLDMRPAEGHPFGTDWGATVGPITTRQAYDWDPATLIEGVDDGSVLGVEAPLWTEFVPDAEALWPMMFPRAICLAEVGWSPAGRDWNDFRTRLAAQRDRLDELGVGCFDDPEVPRHDPR